MSAYIFLNRQDLSDEKSRLAVSTGAEMRRGAAIKGLMDCKKSKYMGQYDIQILGSLCEMAFCEWFGCRWFPRFKPALDDFGGVQIKGVAEPWKNLLVSADYSDSTIFVLVYQVSPVLFDIVGWMGMAEVKDEYSVISDYYLVPRHELHPMATLRAELDKRKGGGLAHPNAGPPFSSVTS